MALTYDSIATTTLTSTATSVTFSSIPSTFTDLRLICYITSVNSASSLGIRLNNSTTTYGQIHYGAVHTTPYNGTVTGTTSMLMNNTNTIQANNPFYVAIDINSYTDVNYATQMLYETNQQLNTTSNRLERGTGYWSTASAVDRIDFINTSSWNFGVGSTFTLYGIKRA